MSITAEQLEQIKAANHSKTLAWEAATFVPGDKVLSYGFTAVRRADGTWIYNDQTFETLSRWARIVLKRTTIDVKRNVFLIKDNVNIPVGRIQPKPVDDEKEKFKVANHAATVAWEAATFNPGDEVYMNSHKAVRSASGTWSYKDQSYETLSRWARALLNVKFADVKRNVFIIKDNKRIPVGQLTAHRKEDASTMTDLKLLITSGFEVIAKRLDAIEARFSRLAESAPLQEETTPPLHPVETESRPVQEHAEPQLESVPLSESMIGSAFIGKYDDKCTGCIQCNDEMYRNYQNQKAEEEEEAERIHAYNEYHGLN